MALKENFLNDVFEGNRKYQIIQNEDGTYSITDVTEYTQEGDLFGAGDINATNAAVNAHIADTANPHNVTAEQVGARPSTWMPTASEVGALPIGGGILNGYLNVLNTLYVSRTINEILYKSAMMPSGYTVGNENATALAHYIGDSQNAMLLINANGLAFRELVNNKQYAIYGEHNKDSMPFLPNTGGKLTGELSVSNGVAHILGYADATSRFAQFGVLHANGNRAYMLNLDTFGNVIVNCYDEQGIWNRDKLIYNSDNITCGNTEPSSAMTTNCIYEMYE